MPLTDADESERARADTSPHQPDLMRDDATRRSIAGRRTLVVGCHALSAVLLMAPLGALAIWRDATVLAVSAIVAVLLVRVLLVNVVPWLERDLHQSAPPPRRGFNRRGP